MRGLLVAMGPSGDKGRVNRAAILLARTVVDLALPPRCPGCGAIVTAQHRFCAGCWNALRFLGPPWCAGCNQPFEFERGDEARCAACLERPPRHAGVRAAVAYGPVARTLALRLKYAGRLGFAKTAAQAMVRLLPDGAELLVPVPLHRWRLWSRGYNQAGLIASALSRASGVPFDAAGLNRKRSTNVLRGLGRRGRARAVAGAFVASDAARIKGRSVVLVDDVYTTGATANACTAALLSAGAASVTILCWARVLPDD